MINRTWYEIQCLAHIESTGSSTQTSQLLYQHWVVLIRASLNGDVLRSESNCISPLPVAPQSKTIGSEQYIAASCLTSLLSVISRTSNSILLRLCCIPMAHLPCRTQAKQHYTNNLKG